MGRLAQVLGICVHGTCEIELAEREFYVGELIVGQVRLTVREAIHGAAFELTFRGMEHISWWVKQGKHDRYHHEEHEGFHRSIRLLNKATILSPGEHIFPFQFQLSLDLPSSQTIYRTSVGYYKRVMSYITYKLEADVKVKGLLTANIGTEAVIGVHGFPPVLSHTIRPVHDETNRSVYLLCCFDRGICNVSGSMDANAVNILAGAITVQVVIQNKSKCRLSGVFVRLNQDLQVHIPNGKKSSGTQFEGAVVVCEQRFSGVDPGEQANLSTVLSIAPIAESFASKKVADPFGDLKRMRLPRHLPLLPTQVTVFGSIRYYVSIKCAIDFAPDIVVELPITVFSPLPGAEQVGQH